MSSTLGLLHRDVIANTQQHRSDLQKKGEQVDGQLERLTTAYLDQALSLDEYRSLKNKLMERKASLKGHIDD